MAPIEQSDRLLYPDELIQDFDQYSLLTLQSSGYFLDEVKCYSETAVPALPKVTVEASGWNLSVQQLYTSCTI